MQPRETFHRHDRNSREWLPTSVYQMTFVRHPLLYTERQSKQNMIRGRSIEGVVAGSIYAACRITNVHAEVNESG